MKRYSNDLRLKVIDLVKSGRQQKEVAELLKVDKSTVYRWYKRYRDTGSVYPKSYHNNKDKIKINPLIIWEIIKKEPSLTLWEIAKKVGNITDVTVMNCIKKLGYTFKKEHGYIKKEMKKEGKKEFVDKISQLPQHSIYYLDESGFDTDMQRLYGYGKIGERVLFKKSGNRNGKRVSIAGVRNHKHQLLYPFQYKGTMNKELFKTYLQNKLLPHLPKDSYLIMDNASVHKGKDIEEIYKNYKINLIYLPPYSPDLNPIEKKWNEIKTIYRKYTHLFEDKVRLIEIIVNN